MNYVICGKFCRCSKVTIESQEVSTSTTIIHTSYLRPLLAGPRVHLAGDGGGLGDAAGPAADAEEVEDDDPRLEVEHDVQSVEVSGLPPEELEEVNVGQDRVGQLSRGGRSEPIPFLKVVMTRD